jgi:hypothetical protein
MNSVDVNLREEDDHHNHKPYGKVGQKSDHVA